MATPEAPTSITADGHSLVGTAAAPILISGASGTLGRAFARICARRNLACRLLGRAEMDIADPASVERAMQRYQPWAVINASGYVRVDNAENDVERCFRDNVAGPAVLAAACARHGVHLTTFSSDLVFDGNRQHPYVESDQVAPLNIYGHSKAAAERAVFEHQPDALVVRSSAFFGPWDGHNFVTQALASLETGAPFAAASDITVTPTYVPDLVNACLDLAIDKESGVWHLSNGDPLSWVELAARAARQAGVDASRLEAQPAAACRHLAPRPAYSALHTERGLLMPGLDDAIGRYLQARGEQARGEQARDEQMRGKQMRGVQEDGERPRSDSIELARPVHHTGESRQVKKGRRQQAN